MAPKPRRSLLVVSLTEAGATLARRIMRLLTRPDCLITADCVHLHRPSPLAETLRSAFLEGQGLVLVMATGIVVRLLAPVIADKRHDPPVLVLDEQGQFVIPLLSAHEGGAQELAVGLAGLLGSRVVSTGTQPAAQPLYVVGMGCERGCSEEELLALFTTSLLRCGQLWPGRIQAVASLDCKHDEPGLGALCKRLELPLICYGAEDLRRLEDRLPNPSAVVRAAVGCSGVAEAAALLHAERLAFPARAQLLVPKQRSQRATCAVAGAFVEAQAPVAAESGPEASSRRLGGPQ